MIAQAPDIAVPPASRPAETPRATGEPATRRRVRLAVVIVTWNRRGYVTTVLEALSRQSVGPENFDVVVVDNASTDGTFDHLGERFAPDATIQNRTDKAHEPAFGPAVRPTAPGRNTLGFGSLTLVRNSANLGGCGGFNTGFAYVAQRLDSNEHAELYPERPNYVWLVDDDIDLPPDTAANLIAAAEADPSIGLVGSRTVDINQRDTTIETAIYFDPATGRMSDEPAPAHRLAASHAEWVKSVGGTRGKRAFHGLRDVDIVSACSLLARWDAVRKIGFWDYRYFIYCDDADWCIRFAQAGWRVVLNLDAVVFHTPWHHKLTPVRGYYAQRNLLWLIQKITPAARLRRVTARWMLGALKTALLALLFRRLFHAEILRRAVDDVVTGRWGKLDDEGPKFEPLLPALESRSLLQRAKTIAVVCNQPESVAWADELRARITEQRKAAGRPDDLPRFQLIVRNDVAQRPETASNTPLPPLVYAPHWPSRLRRQLPLLSAPPDAVVMFDANADFPLFTGGINVHIDRRQPEKCQIETDGFGPRLAFLSRWFGTLFSMIPYLLNLRPYRSATRYG